MKLLLNLLLLFTMSPCSYSQTVIEMAHPEDADLIFLQVNDPFEADIRIYKTDDILEAMEWDCMWRFKEWGFSNFGIYIVQNINDTILIDEDTGKKFRINAKIYFVEDKNLRGYSKRTLGIDGLMRIHRK